MTRKLADKVAQRFVESMPRAPRKKKAPEPPPPPPPPPPRGIPYPASEFVSVIADPKEEGVYDNTRYALEAIESAVSKEVSEKLIRREGAARFLRDSKFTPQGSDSFSSGTYADEDRGLLGYSFTMRYPEKVLQKGQTVATLSLEEVIRKAILKERCVITDEAEFKRIVDGLDLSQVIQSELSDYQHPDDDFDLRTSEKEPLIDAADSEVHQSIEAYFPGRGTVELNEYPSIHLKYRFDSKGYDFKVTGKGDRYTVSWTNEWKVRPSHWMYSFEEHWHSHGY